jgi:hypothetical protein
VAPKCADRVLLGIKVEKKIIPALADQPIPQSDAAALSVLE